MNSKLTKQQFDLLVYLVSVNNKVSQRTISSSLNWSLGQTNKIYTQLKELGLVLDSYVTKKGKEVLNNYKVKRAVIIAAGFGSRMVPITINTPKPMVKVNGKRMIETTLDALISSGIEEIYIVRGYLSDQFDILLSKYPTIHFIDNLDYNNSNNISSAMLVKQYMRNAYVLDGDLYLTNPNLISKYQYNTNYLGVRVKRTDDWCFLTKGGFVNSISVGGVNCYKWIGISYWSDEDGIKLANSIEKLYLTPGGKERFWDQAPLEFNKNEFKVSIRECNAEDVVEIDTLDELMEIDSSYKI